MNCSHENSSSWVADDGDDHDASMMDREDATTIPAHHHPPARTTSRARSEQPDRATPPIHARSASATAGPSRATARNVRVFDEEKAEAQEEEEEENVYPTPAREFTSRPQRATSLISEQKAPRRFKATKLALPAQTANELNRVDMDFVVDLLCRSLACLEAGESDRAKLLAIEAIVGFGGFSK